MITLTFLDPQTSDPNSAAWCIFMSNLGVAFSDVLVDSLMVIQSRKYPDGGAEELMAFAWVSLSVGGFIGSFIAAIFTQNYEPKYCFAFSALLSIGIAIVAC